jgi:Mrp family chromosome partitioning ATPase
MIHQIGETILFVGGIFRNSNSISEILSSPVIDSCFEMLKKKFEIIVIDSPPATVSPEGLAICSKVDGVILVVEAERVRWPVAQNTKENILRNGGKIIGIVFNKHRHYIPEFVYQRL